MTRGELRSRSEAGNMEERARVMLGLLTGQGRGRVMPYIDKIGGALLVRIPEDFGGESKRFAIQREGSEGPLGALKRAIAWRDRRLPEYWLSNESVEATRVNVLRRHSSTKRQLIAGVSSVFHPDDKRQLVGFQTNVDHGWPRYFSVAQHGSVRSAFCLAIRCRLAWEARIWGAKSGISEADWLLLFDEAGLSDMLAGRSTPVLDEGGRVSVRSLQYPGSISHPDPRSCQARIRVNGATMSATFAYRRFYGKQRACCAAVVWLIRSAKAQSNAHLSPNMKLAAPGTARNRGGGRAGVWLARKERRGHEYWHYAAGYQKQGKNACKAFTFGLLEDADKRLQSVAYTAACAFREAYETATADKRRFDHDAPEFADWRSYFDREGVALLEPPAVPLARLENMAQA